MFGNIPPFFSPFPYGPVPTPGVPSTQFVDLFNDQAIIAGNKKFQGSSTVDAAITINRADTPGNVKSFLTMGNANPGVSSASIEFLSNTTSYGVFAPMMRMTPSATTSSSVFRFQAAIGNDTGTTPIAVFDFRIPTSTAITTRSLLSLQNAGAEFAKFTASGGFDVSGGTTPSVKVGSSGTAITQVRVYAPSITPASVAALTSAEQTFTVTGLTTADHVSVNSVAGLTNGIGIVGVRVSAADTLAIRFSNSTAGALTPTAGVYPILATRS